MQFFFFGFLTFLNGSVPQLVRSKVWHAPTYLLIHSIFFSPSYFFFSPSQLLKKRKNNFHSVLGPSESLGFKKKKKKQYQDQNQNQNQKKKKMQTENIHEEKGSIAEKNDRFFFRTCRKSPYR